MNLLPIPFAFGSSIRSFRRIESVKLPVLLLLFLLLLFGVKNNLKAAPESVPAADEGMEVGVARIDITPERPIRLAGYGRRKTESEGVLQRLEAKAIAFGSDSQGPSIFITVDLIGIPGHITDRVAGRLSESIGLDSAQLAISSTHTHSGPEIGNLLNHFGEPLPPEQLGHIVQYLDRLAGKLEQVALAALRSRSPALVAWGQGEVGFAKNRRSISDIRPVDHSMPLLRITDLNGKLRAVLVNYACHGTTLGGDINKIHGDWMGEAQRIIEERHPGITAMIAIGAGADANPEPRLKMEYTTLHGKEIADEVDRLLTTSLQSLKVPPVGRYKSIELPYAHVPTVQELVQQSKARGSKGYYARLALDRLARGEAIPTSLTYPVQTWTFGEDLVMVILAGEVVVDYTLRLKKELGAERLWITSYANDVPCYIASRRVIREGGYEVEYSMYSYNRPSPFVEHIEDLIVDAVHELLPESLKSDNVTPATHPKGEVVRPDMDGVLRLRAENGRASGPEIKYMAEWKAFGWFTAADRVKWDVEIKKSGRYDVHLKWSVSDEEAGKPFVFKAGSQQLKGIVGRTGSWETFKTEKIGHIQLSAGHQEMVFKPDSNFKKGALLDLRGLMLVPVE